MVDKYLNISGNSISTVKMIIKSTNLHLFLNSELTKNRESSFTISVDTDDPKIVFFGPKIHCTSIIKRRRSETLLGATLELEFLSCLSSTRKSAQNSTRNCLTFSSKNNDQYNSS